MLVVALYERQCKHPYEAMHVPSICRTRAVEIGNVVDDDRLTGAGCVGASGVLTLRLRTTNPFRSVIQDSTESNMLSSGWRLRSGARGGWPGILTIVTGAAVTLFLVVATVSEVFVIRGVVPRTGGQEKQGVREHEREQTNISTKTPAPTRVVCMDGHAGLPAADRTRLHEHMNPRAIFPMPSPCCDAGPLVSPVKGHPTSHAQVYRSAGAGAGGAHVPMGRPNERRRVFPRPTAALGRRRALRLGVWMSTSDGPALLLAQSRLRPGLVDVTIRLLPFPPLEPTVGYR